MFIFGSGYSINDITKSEWKKIRDNGSTFSFNNFYRGKFIDMDYHLLKDVRYGSMLYKKTKSDLSDDMNMMMKNPHYKKTKYFLFVDRKKLINAPYVAIRGCTYLYFFSKLLDSAKNRIGFFAHKYSYVPTESVRELPHVPGKVSTLYELINISYLMGFKRIVLVGLDLYDFRYFWQDIPFKEGNHDIAKPTLDTMKVWKRELKKRNVNVYVYNEKSLLADMIPVFNYKKK